MLAADPAVVPVAGVVFLATLVRSAFGFGEALVAVPLLAFVIPVPVAVPLATLLSVTVAALILAQDWRHVHARSPWRLVFPPAASHGVYWLWAAGTAIVREKPSRFACTCQRRAKRIKCLQVNAFAALTGSADRGFGTKRSQVRILSARL